ncbi:metal ABC transporter substrate-binding protein [Bosea vaviloviae]|uniref:Metal ABC transporter substrate-binding protein n=1 Tax=Bosea vaviloviae TaxID=1526658 RepID=A0A1D7UCI8_9HYPH|nr:metal ABC transporter substrate-binding protein [Bosea vaviloviae]AOO85054.1 metal ABC transporter substrate-binding protein [Bosea vaviloviae]
MITRRHVLALAPLALSIPALSRLARAQDRLPVVASFSILGDLVANIGGERIALSTLVGPNGDAHVYSPSPSDARKVKEARLIVTNGLKFEGWIARLIRSSATNGAVVEAARGVKTIVVDENSPAHDHGDHSHAGETDPHAWQSVVNARVYIANIRAGLIAADPAGNDSYEANASAYLAKLDALEQEIMALLAKIPAERRRIITSHDAFGYFGDAYGLAFIAPQGISTEAQASARDVGRIIQQVRKDRIAAVFLENISDARLARRIAEESGAKIGGTLYSDALSDASGPAATYLDMMRHNARTITEALTPRP